MRRLRFTSTVPAGRGGKSERPGLLHHDRLVLTDTAPTDEQLAVINAGLAARRRFDTHPGIAAADALARDVLSKAPASLAPLSTYDMAQHVAMYLQDARAAIAKSDANEAALYGFLAGEWQRALLFKLRHEGDAVAGAPVREGRASGSARRHDGAAERHARWRSRFLDLTEAGMKKTAARDKIAKEARVHPKTVQKALGKTIG